MRTKSFDQTKGQKTTVYIDEWTQVELQQESLRLERPVSYVARKAWELALAEIRAMPSQVGEP